MAKSTSIDREDSLYGEEIIYDMHSRCFTPIVYIDLSVRPNPRWSHFTGFCPACRTEPKMNQVVSVRGYHNPNPGTEI